MLLSFFLTFLNEYLPDAAIAVLSGLRVTALKLGHIARSRAYGSAAAAQLQYDYYDDEDYEFHGESSEPMLRIDSAGSPPKRGVQWVLIGDPGVKKHVYAEKLSKLLEVPRIFMGILVRQEFNPRSALYKQIANAVNGGKFVPEYVIFALLSKRLEEGYYGGESGFILDGIPRTRIQACTEEQLVKKNLETEACASVQEFQSIGSAGFSSADADCAWREKLRIYAEQGKTLEDYYRKQRKLLDFQVAGAPGETWQGLLAALHFQHVNAVNSSQKLTA